MGVVYTEQSEYAKEMCRWNAQHTSYGPGKRPYTFAEFPKRLYLAGRKDGAIVILDAQTAKDDHEERNLLSRGFHFGQDVAIAAIEREQLEHGTLAAEREWEIQHGRLSPKAAAEVRAAEAEHGARHLPEMPRKRTRGRPRKPVASASATSPT